MSKLYQKDLTALTDLMNYEQSACKKCEFYASQLTDPATQEIIGALARGHRARFQSLYDFLNKM